MMERAAYCCALFFCALFRLPVKCVKIQIREPVRDLEAEFYLGPRKLRSNAEIRELEAKRKDLEARNNLA